MGVVCDLARVGRGDATVRALARLALAVEDNPDRDRREHGHGDQDRHHRGRSTTTFRAVRGRVRHRLSGFDSISGASRTVVRRIAPAAPGRIISPSGRGAPRRLPVTSRFRPRSFSRFFGRTPAAVRGVSNGTFVSASVRRLVTLGRTARTGLRRLFRFDVGNFRRIDGFAAFTGVSGHGE